MASWSSALVRTSRSLAGKFRPQSASRIGAGTAVRWYRAAVCTELGKPLVVQDISGQDALKPNEVRLDVHYAGINFADILTSIGKYQEKPPLPAVLGFEVSGIVTGIGSEVTDLSKGDAVLGVLSSGGGFAEECVISEDRLWRVPEGMNMKDAAGVPVSYGTAYLGLTRRANVQKGDTVLVTAAAGAVGLATVDIAANVLHAKVIGAASSEEKLKLVAEKGASHVINYKKESIKDKVMEFTEGKGVHVIAENVGGAVFQDCLKCLRWEGRILGIGFASGDVPSVPAGLLLVKNISAVGLYWGAYSKMNPPVFRLSLVKALSAVSNGHVSPHVSAVFDLDKVNEAIQHILSRKSTGKVVLKMR